MLLLIVANVRLTRNKWQAKRAICCRVQAMVRQFRTQLDRLPQQTIYGRTTLEGALAIMGEMEERLAHAEALQLLQQVDEARERLDALKKQIQEAKQADDQTLAEIKRLEEFIAENSQRAGRTIATGQ